MRTLLSMLLVSLGVGCSDDPVSYSAPVGINLKAKSSDSVAGTISEEKGINTESANPYGAFVADARAKLGMDPGEIDVDRVELLLGSSSSGVVSLGEVFDGTVEILFKMNDTDNSYVVAAGAISSATTSGPISLDVSFAERDVSAIDHSKLLSGSFKVVARGPTKAGFSTKNAEAELQVTLTFEAFE